MLKLDVELTFPDGKQIFCGEIFTTIPDSKGWIEGAFRYTPEYLKDPRAFTLDPAHLPLSPKEFVTDRTQGVHGVFEDALPDDWGRQLLCKKANLPRAEQTVPNLLKAMGSNGLGALSFHDGKTTSPKEPSASIKHLGQLIDAAMKYDAGRPVDDDALQALFTCGSSPGGARPKALIKNRAGYWIAKFPKFDDKYQIEPIETATLQLAEEAGLDVPNYVLQPVAGRNALLLKRFDITEQGGRNHMISMQTLLGADGYYHLSYSDLFSVVRKYSTDPEQDTAGLYRQMVFNAAIGNTDDHLKNFCLLHTDQGYTLSPAYDLLPDVNQNREHRLSFPQGAGTLPPDRKIMERIGDTYKAPDPDQVIDEVISSVSEWQDVFYKYGVPEQDLQLLEPGINRRLDKLKGPDLSATLVPKR